MKPTQVELKAKRREFAVEWAEKMRELGIEDPCGLNPINLRFDAIGGLWRNAAKQAKRLGLYPKSTHHTDSGLALRRMAQEASNE